MKETDVNNFVIAFFLWGVGIGFIIMELINSLGGYTYKQGQIDALNGIVKYKKEIQKDSSVIWVEIKQK